MDVILGIDGGGTRTRASVVVGERILAFAKRGSIKRLQVEVVVSATSNVILMALMHLKIGCGEVDAQFSGRTEDEMAELVFVPEMESQSYLDEITAFVRRRANTGCSPNHSDVRLLMIVNKAQHTNNIELPVTESALADCVQFKIKSPTTGAAPVLSDGKLYIEEPAESITVYQVQ